MSKKIALKILISGLAALFFTPKVKAQLEAKKNAHSIGPTPTTTPKEKEKTLSNNINVKQVHDIISSPQFPKDWVLVDVRTPEEVARGKIKSSQNIDFHGKSFEIDITKFDKNKKILVYCASGVRSAKAQSFLIKQGYRHVYNMLGGYKAWSQVYK